MRAPLFSIITITCNNLAGLKRTHASIKDLTSCDFEWIVIDGASDDGTLDYLKETREPGAQCYSEHDRGIYDAMNKGIEKANGDYLIFMNAGDEFAAPNTLDHITEQIEQSETIPAFIYGDALEAEPGQPAFYKKSRSHKKAAYGLITHHQAMLYRREGINTLRYDLGYPIAADYKFTLEFLDKSDAILYCPFAVCLYESGGLSQQQARQGRREQKQIRRELEAVSALKNNWIALQQSFSMALRSLCPRLYWFLR